MKILRYKKDRLPITIILCLSAIDFYVFLAVDNIYFLVGYFLLMVAPRACISAFGHHMAHTPPFNYRFLHHIFEFFVGLHTGITNNMWTLHHNIGHHKNFMDQSLDSSAWKHKGKKMGVVKYVALNTALAYPRGLENAMSRPRILKETILGYIATIVFLSVCFYANVVGAVFVYLLPMITSLIVTFYVTYEHHSGLDTDNIYKSCRNRTLPLYNLVTCNLGFHTAHHMSPNVHWSELPALHKTIQDKIPKELVDDKSFF